MHLLKRTVKSKEIIMEKALIQLSHLYYMNLGLHHEFIGTISLWKGLMQLTKMSRNQESHASLYNSNACYSGGIERGGENRGKKTYKKRTQNNDNKTLEGRYGLL